MIYDKIVNPITGRKVNIKTKQGKKILEKYIKISKQKGGVSLISNSDYEPVLFDITCLISNFLEEEGIIGSNMSTSFYNPGITFLSSNEYNEYYHLVVRCDTIPDFLDTNDYKVELDNFKPYFEYGNPNYGDQQICDYPGSVYNKWFPYFWNRPGSQNKNIYMVIEYNIQSSDFNIIKGLTIDNLWDLRIAKLESSFVGDNNDILLWGNFSHSDRQPIFGKNSEGQIVNSNIAISSEKIGALHFKTDVFITSNQLNNIVISNFFAEKGLGIDQIAPNISMIDKSEKNYALYYLHNRDIARTYGNGSPGMLLQYHMSRNEGIEFYFQVGNGMNLSAHNWDKIIPANSDFFKRFEKLFKFPNYENIAEMDGSETVRQITSIDSLARVSCTTPLILGIDRKFLGVGHLKISLWKYIDKIINNHKPLHYEENDIEFDEKTSKFWKFYENILSKSMFTNMCNQTDNMLKIKTDLKPLGIKPSSITDMSLAGLKYLANNGTIILNLNEEGNNFSDLIINRNFHPEYIYFMFFYKIDYETLELDSFSAPFIIANGRETSYLNFPVGLTSPNEDNIILSYGDGDVRTIISSWTNEQIERICSYDNENDIDDVNFILVKNLQKVSECYNSSSAEL